MYDRGKKQLMNTHNCMRDFSNVSTVEFQIYSLESPHTAQNAPS